MDRRESLPQPDFLKDLLGDLSLDRDFEGFLTKGTVVAIANNETLIVDAGLKAEARIPLSDLRAFEPHREIAIGDEVDIYVDKLEDYQGNLVISVEKAFREKNWRRLEKAMKEQATVNGKIVSPVKAGYAADIDGIVAFLPRTQVDVRVLKETEFLFNEPQRFKVMKMDRQRNNVVVSRREVIEEERAEARTKFVAELEENQIVSGIVKNITDYGAFVDLGGVDGLLHVIDISWKRINHPSDVLTVGDAIQVKVIRFNKETGRISLGMKQLEADPWVDMKERIHVGDTVEGEVTNITDYGAFIELFPGIEGLIYITELSWTKKNAHPLNFVQHGQRVSVRIMDIDIEKRRISLSLKRTQANPWQNFLEAHPVSSVVEGVVRNVTEFGVFVALDAELDGMIHLADLTWEKDMDKVLTGFKKDQRIKVAILDVSPEKERISLGIKQLHPKNEEVMKEAEEATQTQ